MNVTRVYTGEDGKSHFEDLRIPSAEVQRPHLPVANAVPVTAAMFPLARAGVVLQQHTAPRRQLLVHLVGHSEIECSDGTTRRFGPGDVVLADDLTGEGHITRVLDEDLRTLVLPLAADADISEWRPGGA
jgi:hypothetical protein